MAAQIWRTSDSTRYFLIERIDQIERGPLVLLSLDGTSASVAEDSARAFEMTEAQSRAWAKAELGNTLDELKTNIDTGLAKVRADLDARNQTTVTDSSPITPNAGAALLDFFAALPRIVGQGISGDDARVSKARETMAELQRRLKDAGIEVDDRLQQFPERLASLRKPPEEPKP